MRIILAPMEGVVDHLMREMLTEIGGFDLCITEFVRVVDQLLPVSVFLPAFALSYCKTAKPCPAPRCVCSYWGKNPISGGLNAVRAVELGSPGVDLNFGCPAKTVNKSKGGACCCAKPNSCMPL